MHPYSTANLPAGIPYASRVQEVGSSVCRWTLLAGKGPDTVFLQVMPYVAGGSVLNIMKYGYPEVSHTFPCPQRLPLESSDEYEIEMKCTKPYGLDFLCPSL